MNDTKLAHFFEALDRDWNWRNKELITLSQMVALAEEAQLPVLTRCGVVLLYSHWEGFIKNASKNILQSYINTDLTNAPKCIVQAHILHEIKSAQCSSFDIKTAKTTFNVLSTPNKTIRNGVEDVVKTYSNLTSSVLTEISELIGIDTSCFELKAALIDRQLIKLRNKICHGEGMPISKEDFNTLYTEIRDLIVKFKELIMDTATIYNTQTKLQDGGGYFSCLS